MHSHYIFKVEGLAWLPSTMNKDSKARQVLVSAPEWVVMVRVNQEYLQYQLALTISPVQKVNLLKLLPISILVTVINRSKKAGVTASFCRHC